MPVIRKLTGKLQFQADTTAATRFDAAINRSKTNLEGLNRLSFAGFISTATKAWGLVGAAATAGSIVAAKKFIDIETSMDALALATKGSFGGIKKEIDDILQGKTLKNLVNEIDLVNAALSVSQEEGEVGPSIKRFLKIATTLGIVAKKPVAGILKQLVTGEIEGILKLIGQLPLELQELLKLSQAEFSKIGLAGRRGVVEQRLLAGQAALEAKINEQRQRGLLTFKELGGAFEKLTVEVGERSLPAFKGLNDILIPIIDRLTRIARLGGGEVGPEKTSVTGAAIETLFPTIGGAAEGPNIFERLQKFTREAISQGRENRTTIPFAPRINPDPEPGPGITSRAGDINITNHITVPSGASAGDIRSVDEAVNRGIRRALGAVSEQARQSTKIRGGN